MPTTSAGQAAAQTVAQIFASLNLIQWWLTTRVTQFFGQNGEAGTDFGLGAFGVPVGSITGGKVVYVGNGGYPGSSIGQIVQILSPSGQLVHYQHLKDSSVSVGQTVNVGSIIGHGGGCPDGCYGSGSSCTCYDQFSTGQHIEVRVASSYNPSSGVWSQSWIDPLPIFQTWAGQTSTGGGQMTSAQTSPPCSSCFSSWNCFVSCITDVTGTSGLGGALQAGTSITSNVSGSGLVQSLAGVIPWITNPVRIIKMVAGGALIFIALLLLIAPESVPLASKVGIV